MCSQTAFKVLNALRDKGLPIETTLRSFELQYAAPDAPRTVGLSGAQKAAISGAPAKIVGRLERLFLAGFDKIALYRLQHGINPFPASGAKHLHLAGQLLLQGGFTAAQLRDKCCQNYGWTPGTASTEVSQAMALLRLLGLTRDNGVVTLVSQP